MSKGYKYPFDGQNKKVYDNSIISYLCHLFNASIGHDTVILLLILSRPVFVFYILSIGCIRIILSSVLKIRPTINRQGHEFKGSLVESWGHLLNHMTKLDKNGLLGCITQYP
jgi:hypothetical protein